jgi:hypothetical protein
LEYQGAKLKAGYGVFHDPSGAGSVLAHRFAYQSYHEITLKSDQYVRHLCNNPACCSPFPGHLAIGSAQDNSDDMVAAKRSLKGRKGAQQRRFTPEEKAQIIKYAASGKSQYWIAKKYGRAESTISQVLHPKRKPKPTPKPKESAYAAAA